MKIPPYMVHARLLTMFARAAGKFNVAPRELVVFLCIAMAAPGTRLQVKSVELLTGLVREEVIESIGHLKTHGFIDQIGDVLPITSRGQELLTEVERD